MDLLLDTHALLWWLLGSDRLGREAQKRIPADGTQCWISTVSVWEIAIKMGRGRLELERPPEDWMPELEEKGFRPLPITFQHAYAVRTLPPHHSDPFDRLLIAQAKYEGLTILTADAQFAPYDVPLVDATK